MDKKDPFKVDRTAFTITTHEQADEVDKRYWLSKSPDDRLEAMELMRQINYDYDPVTDRIPRLLEVVERTQR